MGPDQGVGVDGPLSGHAHHAPPASFRAAPVRPRRAPHRAWAAMGGGRHRRARAGGAGRGHHARGIPRAVQRHAQHELPGGGGRHRRLRTVHCRCAQPPCGGRVRRSCQQRLLRGACAAASLHPAGPRTGGARQGSRSLGPARPVDLAAARCPPRRRRQAPSRSCRRRRGRPDDGDGGPAGAAARRSSARAAGRGGACGRRGG
mmetsp:Transcript_15928/g.39141  ORF Transcript_15928/g.39141 Transcript_15928/m.39141 type:complete len:203 (-) Transcript_15928:673-1281(-)